MRTGLIYDNAYLKHDTGFHAEKAGRCHLRASWPVRVFGKTSFRQPRPATLGEVSLVHLPEYIDKVRVKQ